MLKLKTQMQKAQSNRLYKDVEFLTELRPYRNYENLDSLAKVVDYLKREFNEMGLVPSLQPWIADGNEYNNVIASYNTEKSKRLIIGAHYDVCGDQPGADDNASAVAGLLETARMISENQPELDYRIDFVAYCLEEPPFFGGTQMGSYIHAQSLHEKKADVIGMICYEMIGYFSDKPNSQPYPNPILKTMYPTTANFIAVVAPSKLYNFASKIHKKMRKDSEIDVQLACLKNFDALDGLAGMSDQSSYWQFNYPAVMINDTAFVRNPNYHQQSDTIETLNFDMMRRVVDSTYNAVISF